MIASSDGISFFSAFLAGLISFLSPCVLPLVPGYLSFVSGVSGEDLKTDSPELRRRVMLHACLFVLGFSLVFVGLGASATAVGTILNDHLPLITKIAGGVIILFGLHMIGVFKLTPLYREARFQLSGKPTGMAGSVLVGMAFAFGWTPCIGPILAGILTYASTQETVGEGMALLAVYSAGLGIPFLATALAVNQFFSFFDKIKKHFHTIEVIGGVLLVAVGILIISGRLTTLASWLQRIPTLNQLAL